MHANSFMINDIFRKQFNFTDGVTVSDCNDIGVLQSFRIAVNKTQAAARALYAGIDFDLICQNPATNMYAGSYLSLMDAINLGYINQSLIEISAKRVLISKFAAGLFDNQTYVTNTTKWKNIVNSQKHQQLAYQAALEGGVKYNFFMFFFTKKTNFFFVLCLYVHTANTCVLCMQCFAVICVFFLHLSFFL